MRDYWQAKKWQKVAVEIGRDAPKACGKSDGIPDVNHGMEDAKISGGA
jgi:hypothetical protein